MKNKTIKLKVFTEKPHTNFAEEIYESQKTHSLLNVMTWIFGLIAFILLIIIINTTR